MDGWDREGVGCVVECVRGVSLILYLRPDEQLSVKCTLDRKLPPRHNLVTNFQTESLATLSQLILTLGIAGQLGLGDCRTLIKRRLGLPIHENTWLLVPFSQTQSYILLLVCLSLLLPPSVHLLLHLPPIQSQLNETPT